MQVDPETRAHLDLPDPKAHLENPEAVATLDQQDPKVPPVVLAGLGNPDLPVPLENPEPPEPRDHPDPTPDPENLDLPGHLVPLANLVALATMHSIVLAPVNRVCS